jgi:hypothetical protein
VEDIFLKISLGNKIGENSFYLLRIWYLWNDINVEPVGNEDKRAGYLQRRLSSQKWAGQICLTPMNSGLGGGCLQLVTCPGVEQCFVQL